MLAVWENHLYKKKKLRGEKKDREAGEGGTLYKKIKKYVNSGMWSLAYFQITFFHNPALRSASWVKKVKPEAVAYKDGLLWVDDWGSACVDSFLCTATDLRSVFVMVL